MITLARQAHPRRWLAPLALFALLAGCGESAARPIGALPTLPVATPQPTVAAPAPRPAPSAAPAGAPTAQPSPTGVLTPTFVRWEDSRGVFAIDLPANWNSRSVPEGVGVTSVSFNALATFSLSFGYQTERGTPEQFRQLAESARDRLLASALVKEPRFNGSDRADGYVLSGEAIVNTQPTAIEVTVRQTPAGALVLETWQAPLELWNDVQAQYVRPMRDSLTIDDEALGKLR